MNSPHKALIALGSNLGDSGGILQHAFKALEQLTQCSISRSSFWKTKPVDCPEGSPCFLNAATSFEVASDIQPEDFLKQLLEIESELGRRRSGIINEPRIIDIDLICLGSIEVNSPLLTLPHPRAHLREFVLAPLNEIEPDFLFPGLHKTTNELLKDLKLETGCIRVT
jgi:2-amino-4-hydroxy-6-hydroxymethyldihydropteridine diphosphokinase